MQEFNTIWNFKKEKCGQGCGDLEPWDETYYTALMKSSTYNLNSSVRIPVLMVAKLIESNPFLLGLHLFVLSLITLNIS